LPFSQSCSIGFTEVGHAELLEDALARADGSLYKGKQGGRDRLAQAQRKRANRRQVPA
jgi:PleD family two-component response regulator